jgi:MFS family permease
MHSQRTPTLPANEGGGSTVRAPADILIPLTLITLAFAPLVFLGNFWLALIGATLWGLGMGVHESIIPAAVATLIAPNRRPSAYGVFTAAYGVFWFLGSAWEFFTACRFPR